MYLIKLWTILKIVLKICAKYLEHSKIIYTFALEIKTVPWMSGLVSGLQNRARRFESAWDLKRDYALV